MKVIDFNGSHRIFGDNLVVNDKLPLGTYDVMFNPQTGYALQKRKDMTVPTKLYGEHEKLADNMIRRYDSLDKNFGVILGGRKGTGKTMLARLVSTKLMEKDIPTIIVSENTPNLPSFLQSIEQKVFVLFDEFEKVFEKNYTDNNGEIDEQTQFLPLFDGLVNNKHFYMITINNYDKLNEYFLGRPGRFHYDIQFDEIALDEIKEILQDQLTIEVENITKLASILFNFNVNYDQLMAIIDELNFGSKIDYIVKYMNLDLFSTQAEREYEFTIYHKNGDEIKVSKYLSAIEPAVKGNYHSTKGTYFQARVLGTDNTIHYYEFNLLIPNNAFDMTPLGQYKIDLTKVKIEDNSDGATVNSQNTKILTIDTQDIKDIKVRVLTDVTTYKLPTF